MRSTPTDTDTDTFLSTALINVGEPEPSVEGASSFQPIPLATGSVPADQTSPGPPQACTASAIAAAAAVSHRPALQHSGRGRNHLQPDAAAEGSHTTLRRNQDGGVSHHIEWTPNARNPSGFDEVKRVDTQHANPHSHRNKATGEEVMTPHTHEPTTPGGIRPARPDELPR